MSNITEGKDVFLYRAAMQTQKSDLDQQQSQKANSFRQTYRESATGEGEMSRSPLASFRAKEEEIERKKLQVIDKVFAQLGRKEEEAKRLAEIREELDSLEDPTRKEVAAIRKRIDAVDRELKPLGRTCLKKENEYKEALEAFNNKSKEKTQLVNALMELVIESERLRMKKLEELSQTVDSFR